MASTLDNRFFNAIRDVPMSTLDGPSPTRIAPVNFGLGQESWDRKTNIWQMTPRTFDYIAHGDRPRVSPTRDNRTNMADLSKIIARAPPGGDHNVTATTGNGTEPALSSSTRPNRPIGPPISPTRPRNNGTLETESTDTAMRSLGQASLLPGSAPDIEPTRSSSSSSSTLAKHHGLTVGRSFRQFNVEEAEEFVPSYLQDHARYTSRAAHGNGAVVQPYHGMPSTLSNHNISPTRMWTQAYGGQTHTRAIGHVDRGRTPPGEAIDWNDRRPDANSQESHDWTTEQTGRGPFTDRWTSNLRPDVPSYEPPARPAGFGGQMPYQDVSRYVGHQGTTAQAWAGTQKHHNASTNASSFNLNAAMHSLNLNSGRHSDGVGSESKHYRHRNTAEFESHHPAQAHVSSTTRSRDAGSGAPPFTPSAPPHYHGTQYGYGPEVQRSALYEQSYLIDPATGLVNYLPDGAFALEPESKNAPRSELLDEFRAYNKSRKYELKDIYGYIVEFSGDQNGSRFIQTKLEQANSDEKDQIFSELQTDARQLMSDVFGNYVIQKMFDYGNQSQKKTLASYMQGYVMKLSLQPYGCRCVQKAFEHILTDQQVALIKELEGNVMTVVESQHGNHVIQKAIECIPGEHIRFIVDAHKNQVVRLSKHIYGCRIVQRMLEHCAPHVKRSILDELQHAIPSLIVDQYGNYVIQCIIRKCDPTDRYRVVEHVKHEVLFYSTHKFASNVVEKALVFAEEDQRVEMIQRLTMPNPDHEMQSPVPVLLRDQYGNYVMQTVLKTIQGPAKRALADEVRYHLNFIGKVSRGKQISAMADTVNAITAGHSPSSTSTGPHTPRTPASLHSGGGMGTPTTASVEVSPPGYGVRELQRNGVVFKPTQT